MDRATPEHNSSSSCKRSSVDFLVSLMVRCARNANRLSKKLKVKQKKLTYVDEIPKSGGGGEKSRWNLSSSPLRSPKPKELFKALSNKAMTTVGRKKNRYDGAENKPAATEEEEHGVWQREILMGGKCEPLNFAGVIYYDCNGRQLQELPPRSPRATPLPTPARSPRDTPLPTPPRSPRGPPLPTYPTRFQAGSPFKSAILYDDPLAD